MSKLEEKPKILVVDDEKPLARALELKLNNAGFNTTVAYDGEEGLALLKKEHFSLAVLDLVMPKINGFALMEKMKSLKINIPIIVLSNLSQKEDSEKALLMGAKYFFIKSDVPISQIVEKVKEELKT